MVQLRCGVVFADSGEILYLKHILRRVLMWEITIPNSTIICILVAVFSTTIAYLVGVRNGRRPIHWRNLPFRKSYRVSGRSCHSSGLYIVEKIYGRNEHPIIVHSSYHDLNDGACFHLERDTLSHEVCLVKEN